MRTRLELATSGVIDLLEDVPYSLNYAIADIRNPESRNSNYSKTIKVAGSKNNNTIFNSIFEININGGYNANLKVACRLYVDELLVMNGYLQLLKINRNDWNEIDYDIVIRGNVGNIFAVWGEGYLTDLDLSAYNHTYNKAAIKASWSATVGTGYVYPMIDYGLTNGLQYGVENFFPAIYVKQYIDSMFTLAGYTYSSSFFNSDFFKRLCIPYNSTTMLLSETELTSRYFQAERSANYVAKTLTSVAASQYIAYTSNLPTLIQINSILSDVGGQFNTGTYYATITDKGTYIFSSTVYFTLSFSGLTTSPSTIPFDNVLNFGIGTFDNSGNLISTLGIGDYIVPSQTITNGGTSATYTVQFFTNPSMILAGTKVGLYLSMDGILLNQAGVININVLAHSTFENKAINTGLFDGDTLQLNTMGIPRNVKIKDFFTSIIKMFNLYVETDKTINNKLYIEPRDDFYSAGVTKDWTDKLAIDRQIEIEPMGELNASRYDFKYKEDKDYWNNRYQSGYLEPYGTKHKDIATDFIKQTKTIDVIFSATPLVNIGTTDRIISQIATQDNSQPPNLIDVKNCNLRILYFTLKNTNNSWTFNSTISGASTETQYPYAGHVDVPLTPTFDLCFGVPQQIYYNTTYYTNNNLYNKYYKKYIEEITDRDSKIVTAWLYLTPLDINILDFRNQFYIHETLYRLNKIMDYNPLSNDLTKCEFIKINQAATFTAQTGLSVYGNNISYNTGELAPQLVLDIINPALLNGGSVIGNGNLVDNTATNVLVNGTGNYIGEGVNNATLFNSSGVTVSPNISNVLLINTNNVLVTQSNTTYVNGQILPTGSISEQGIVAHAGGGQSLAYQTTKKYNLIETVATAGDSIITLHATLDSEQFFKNIGAQTLYVYPKSGEQFRKGTTLMGANVPYQIAPRNSLHIYCYEDSIWSD
jgi:hypothetical protein